MLREKQYRISEARAKKIYDAIAYDVKFEEGYCKPGAYWTSYQMLYGTEVSIFPVTSGNHHQAIVWLNTKGKRRKISVSYADNYGRFTIIRYN